MALAIVEGGIDIPGTIYLFGTNHAVGAGSLESCLNAASWMVDGSEDKLAWVSGADAVVCIAGWAIVCDLILFTILKKTVGVRVSEREELEGLDATEHGLETGYAGFLMDKDN